MKICQLTSLPPLRNQTPICSTVDDTIPLLIFLVALSLILYLTKKISVIGIPTNKDGSNSTGPSKEGQTCKGDNPRSGEISSNTENSSPFLTTGETEATLISIFKEDQSPLIQTSRNIPYSGGNIDNRDSAEKKYWRCRSNSKNNASGKNGDKYIEHNYRIGYRNENEYNQCEKSADLEAEQEFSLVPVKKKVEEVRSSEKKSGASSRIRENEPVVPGGNTDNHGLISDTTNSRRVRKPVDHLKHRTKEKKDESEVNENSLTTSVGAKRDTEANSFDCSLSLVCVSSDSIQSDDNRRKISEQKVRRWGMIPKRTFSLKKKGSLQPRKDSKFCLKSSIYSQHAFPIVNSRQTSNDHVSNQNINQKLHSSLDIHDESSKGHNNRQSRSGNGNRIQSECSKLSGRLVKSQSLLPRPKYQSKRKTYVDFDNNDLGLGGLPKLSAQDEVTKNIHADEKDLIVIHEDSVELEESKELKELTKINVLPHNLQESNMILDPLGDPSEVSYCEVHESFTVDPDSMRHEMGVDYCGSSLQKFANKTENETEYRKGHPVSNLKECNELFTKRGVENLADLSESFNIENESKVTKRKLSGYASSSLSDVKDTERKRKKGTSCESFVTCPPVEDYSEKGSIGYRAKFCSSRIQSATAMVTLSTSSNSRVSQISNDSVSISMREDCRVQGDSLKNGKQWTKKEIAFAMNVIKSLRPNVPEEMFDKDWNLIRIDKTQNDKTLTPNEGEVSNNLGEQKYSKAFFQNVSKRVSDCCYFHGIPENAILEEDYSSGKEEENREFRERVMFHQYNMEPFKAINSVEENSNAGSLICNVPSSIMRENSRKNELASDFSSTKHQGQLKNGDELCNGQDAKLAPKNDESDRHQDGGNCKYSKNDGTSSIAHGLPGIDDLAADKSKIKELENLSDDMDSNESDEIRSSGKDASSESDDSNES